MSCDINLVYSYFVILGKAYSLSPMLPKQGEACKLGLAAFWPFTGLPSVRKREF